MFNPVSYQELYLDPRFQSMFRGGHPHAHSLYPPLPPAYAAPHLYGMLPLNSIHERFKFEEEAAAAANRQRQRQEEEAAAREAAREQQREKERELREQREREQREKEQREREQREKEQREKEQRDKEAREREMREKEREARERDRLLSASHHYTQMYAHQTMRNMPPHLIGQLLPPGATQNLNSLALGLRPPPPGSLHSISSLSPYHPSSSQRQSPHQAAMNLNLSLGMAAHGSLNLSHHLAGHPSVPTSLSLGHPGTNLASLAHPSLGLGHPNVVPTSMSINHPGLLATHQATGLNLSSNSPSNVSGALNLGTGQSLNLSSSGASNGNPSHIHHHSSSSSELREKERERERENRERDKERERESRRLESIAQHQYYASISNAAALLPPRSLSQQPLLSHPTSSTSHMTSSQSHLTTSQHSQSPRRSPSSQSLNHQKHSVDRINSSPLNSNNVINLISKESKNLDSGNAEKSSTTPSNFDLIRNDKINNNSIIKEAENNVTTTPVIVSVPQGEKSQDNDEPNLNGLIANSTSTQNPALTAVNEENHKEEGKVKDSQTQQTNGGDEEIKKINNNEVENKKNENLPENLPKLSNSPKHLENVEATLNQTTSPKAPTKNSSPNSDPFEKPTPGKELPTIISKSITGNNGAEAEKISSVPKPTAAPSKSPIPPRTNPVVVEAKKSVVSVNSNSTIEEENNRKKENEEGSPNAVSAPLETNPVTVSSPVATITTTTAAR